MGEFDKQKKETKAEQQPAVAAPTPATNEFNELTRDLQIYRNKPLIRIEGNEHDYLRPDALFTPAITEHPSPSLNLLLPHARFQGGKHFTETIPEYQRRITDQLAPSAVLPRAILDEDSKLDLNQRLIAYFQSLSPEEQNKINAAGLRNLDEQREQQEVKTQNRKEQLSILLNACNEVINCGENPGRTSWGWLTEKFGGHEEAKKLKWQVEQFLYKHEKNENGEIIESLPKLELHSCIESGCSLEQALYSATKGNFDHPIYKVAQEFKLGEFVNLKDSQGKLTREFKINDVPDDKFQAEEYLLFQQAELLNVIRTRHNDELVEQISLAALKDPIDKLIDKIPADKKEEIIKKATEEAKAKFADFKKHLEEPSQEMVDRGFIKLSQLRNTPGSEHIADDILDAIEKEAIEKNVRHELTREAFRNLNSFLGTSKEKQAFLDSLTPGQKKVWEQFNDSSDPTGEWFNIKDSTKTFLIEEAAINVALLVATGGIATVGRAAALGTAKWLTMKMVAYAGSKTLLRPVARSLLRNGFVKASIRYGTKPIIGAIGAAEGAMLFEDMTSLGGNSDLFDKGSHAERLAWKTAEFGVPGVAGNAVRKLMGNSTITSSLISRFSGNKELQHKLLNMAGATLAAAEKELFATSAEALALVAVEGYKEKHFNGSAEDFAKHFDSETLFRALLARGALNGGEVLSDRYLWGPGGRLTGKYIGEPLDRRVLAPAKRLLLKPFGK